MFALRCMVDLQLATIVEHLRPALREMRGSVLDVGAGQSPWRAWLPDTTTYQGVDVEYASQFGMASHPPDVTYYDGRRIPFEEAQFDNAMCIEVLEHSDDPNGLLREIARVLRPDARLVLTVPWSARRHHLPHDYHRFSRDALELMFSAAGFSRIAIQERGTDIHAIANKLTIVSLRWLNPTRRYLLPLTIPFCLLCSSFAFVFILAAHLARLLPMGSPLDPLGYFVDARKASVSYVPTKKNASE
jgi:SAM-dependent methyltransferase